MKRIRTTIYLEPYIHDILIEKAHNEGLPLSTYLCKILSHYAQPQGITENDVNENYEYRLSKDKEYDEKMIENDLGAI